MEVGKEPVNNRGRTIFLPYQAAFWLGVATNAAASSNLEGVLISGNIVDNELTNILQGLNYHIANNVDQNGKLSRVQGADEQYRN